MKFKYGEVVFSKDDGEYVQIRKVGPAQELGMTEVEIFNPRYGGTERVRDKTLRKLTAKEHGT